MYKREKLNNDMYWYSLQYNTCGNTCDIYHAEFYVQKWLRNFVLGCEG